MAWIQRCISRNTWLRDVSYRYRTLPRRVQRRLCTNIWQGPGTGQDLQKLMGTRAAFIHSATPFEAAGAAKGTPLAQRVDSDSTGKVLEVTWWDDSVSRYHTAWLRHNCQCDQCNQPHTGQKVISIVDYPCQLTIQFFTLLDNGKTIKIRCKEENHHCVLPVEWLKKHSYSARDLEHRAALRNVKYLENTIGSFTWENINRSEDAYFECLDHLNVYGITLIKNVPVDSDSITKVASLIGPVTTTLYGRTFDVKSESKPINVAYSSVALGYHMDLVYYESPPGLQLLHCLQFDDVVTGGESIFIDSFCIAEQFQQQYPEHFQTLTRVPATFQKIHFERENPVAYMYQRPHINVNHTGQITAVTWAPPFEGPLLVPEENVEPYFEAYRQFCLELETSQKGITSRLQPGDCVIFNNRRILHGRTQFQENGGVRHFKGCYVNIDDFRNKIQYLHEKRGFGEMAKRVGNQCMF